MADTNTLPSIATHGAERLPSVTVDSYNVELKDDEGFIGDRASKGAFRDMIENWRKHLRKAGDDPFGDTPSDEITKKELDGLLAKGDPEAAGIVQGAIEDFSQELALVIRRYLKLKGWKDTERIVVGGGFRASRIGELVIGRTSVILKADKVAIELVPVRNAPDEAGLIGAAHLAPKWMFKAHDAILAVDIGGTNIRAGVIGLNLKKAVDLSKAFVWKYELWRHGDEKKVSSRRCSQKAHRDARGPDREGSEGEVSAGAVHRNWLPGYHQPGRLDRAGRAEPAGQLGGEQLPSACSAAQSHPEGQ